VKILEGALERAPDDPSLLGALAQLENTDGRRARAIELASHALSLQPGAAGAGAVPGFLELLRVARDAGEISEERWWAEVEALEAERPEDPAPVRELAARAFERAEDDGTGTSDDAFERLARFRVRTLDRPLETLRVGEGERWVELLARSSPGRVVSFAEEELRLDPSDPGLWRASAVALLAAGQARSALERLQALHEVAPEPETARLLALTGLRVEDDPEAFAKRVTAMKHFDPSVADDAVLSFYTAMFAPDAGDELAGLERARKLWNERAGSALAEPEHGRALALQLYDAGQREPALRVLDDTRSLAQSALERDVLGALAYTMQNAPTPPRKAKGAPPRPAPTADDAPGAIPGKSKGKGKAVAAESDASQEKPKAAGKGKPKAGGAGAAKDAGAGAKNAKKKAPSSARTPSRGARPGPTARLRPRRRRGSRRRLRRRSPSSRLEAERAARAVQKARRVAW
jgi:hypothetical protein